MLAGPSAALALVQCKQDAGHAGPHKSGDFYWVDAGGVAFKDDGDKPPWHLLPLDALVPVVRVFEYGLRKYGKQDSWKEVRDPVQRYYSALMRHLAAWRSGEELDESGEHHLSHVAWNAIVLLWFVVVAPKRGTR